MKIINKTIYLVFFYFVLQFLSCGLKAQSDWSKIEYYFDAGPLPPPYHYSYTITIGSVGKGSLEYTGDFEKGSKNTKNYMFELNKSELDILKDAIKESDVLNLDIKERPNAEIPDGGHYENMQIFGIGDKNETKEPPVLKNIPSYPELKYEKILDKLYTAIQKSVPENIRKELNFLK